LEQRHTHTQEIRKVQAEGEVTCFGQAGLPHIQNPMLFVVVVVVVACRIGFCWFPTRHPSLGSCAGEGGSLANEGDSRKGRSEGEKVCRTLKEKPHAGSVRVPFMNTTTCGLSDPLSGTKMAAPLSLRWDCSADIVRKGCEVRCENINGERVGQKDGV